MTNTESPKGCLEENISISNLFCSYKVLGYFHKTSLSNANFTSLKFHCETSLNLSFPKQGSQSCLPPALWRMFLKAMILDDSGSELGTEGFLTKIYQEINIFKKLLDKIYPLV